MNAYESSEQLYVTALSSTIELCVAALSVSTALRSTRTWCDFKHCEFAEVIPRRVLSSRYSFGYAKTRHSESAALRHYESAASLHSYRLRHSEYKLIF